MTEQKVLDALALAMSIPLPESDTAPMALNKVRQKYFCENQQDDKIS